MRGIYFAVLAHRVGWVKRDVGTIYVGFAYLKAPQKFEIATKLANPTRLVADRRLNPTYDLSFRLSKWIPPLLMNIAGILSFYCNVENPALCPRKTSTSTLTDSDNPKVA